MIPKYIDISGYNPEKIFYKPISNPVTLKKYENFIDKLIQDPDKEAIQYNDFMLLFLEFSEIFRKKY